ncbi:hypothetical protein F0169_22650 [Pseudomonas sp. MAFF 212408]|uniref:Uncharacterized protein n=1 Tax=Pseudomonas kitaguniensis TaxID=2607908 RepID=A0A5N7KR22_9PSED|nr:hypothetical protein [Pseudomonas kitaguniensis]MPR04624.1 hypothetical protein [Pseudomonas kitaguniensis]
MSAQPITTFNTNTQEGSVHEVVLGCDKLWAMGQEEAIRRLSDRRSPSSNNYELVADFSARAARIAAAYASFYLEQGEDGKPELKGRFYWMGLAAFASKQVRCGLDFIPNEPYLLMTPLMVQPALRIGKNFLGEGNFWLFQDIFVWHWFYRKYPDQFEECAPERDVGSFEGQIKASVESLPWADDALPILKGLRVTKFITQAFIEIQKVETLPSGPQQLKMRFLSLISIADHEQRLILQPLIYDHPRFQETLEMQASFEWAPFVPVRVAAFSAACDVEQPELKVRMTEGELYDESDRMVFISDIAAQYDFLMQTKTDYMEGEMRAISKWANAR